MRLLLKFTYLSHVDLRGWTIENVLEIEQCKNDKFVKELREHKNEGN